MIALEPFLAWAQRNDHIRGLILTGSMANDKAVKDHLSDYDIAVFGQRFDFIAIDDWLNEFQEFWICIHDKFDLLGFEIPTRLVIFNDKLKIDFSFHPPEILKNMIEAHELPDDLNLGYKILLDTREQKRNTADIGYDPAARIVYVPTFLKKSVVAYRLK